MSSRSSSLIRAAALAACVGLLASGCRNASAGSPTPTPAQAPAPTETPASHPRFDGAAAFKLLEQQCAFGPRPVGSAAHQRTRDFLVAEMRKLADRTDVQDFTYRGLPLTNIVGVFNPAAKRSVLLCGHWDTRPTADQEVDEAKRRRPIPGASDGASETAVLLELARMFKQQKPAVGAVIVLFDGEDYGSFEKDEGVFLGSRYFARNHREYHPEYGVLLDMVGDKNLNILREQNSDRYAPGTNARLFAIAKELGYGQFIINKAGYTISDDHMPLNQYGHIPTVDLIDFDYSPWHTLDDTPDKCSPESLAMVGSTVAELVYREKDR